MTHHCHWPGCKIIIKPSEWACFVHWKIMPQHIKGFIFNTYKRQGISESLYLEAAQLANDFAVKYELRKKEKAELLKGIEELGEEFG